MTDQLEMRDAIDAAVKEHEGSTNEENVVQTTTPVEEIVSSEKVDALGEQKSGDDSTAVAEKNVNETAANVDVKSEEEEGANSGVLGKQHRVDRPPASWRKESKETWNELPLNVRQEVYRRENDINKTLNETAQVRQFAEQFNQVVNPYLVRIRSAGADPIQAVDALMKADYTLATAPMPQRAEFMAGLIANYGIDINALADALAGKPQQQSQQNAAPDIEKMVELRLQQALAPLYQQQQQIAQQSQQQIVQTVESMSLDPKYPYFEDLREEMADLIELSARRGIDITLTQAYDKALKMTGKSDELASMSAMQTQHAQAARAKAASSSISGSPAGGGAQAVVSDGSLRGDLEAAMANMNRI